MVRRFKHLFCSKNCLFGAVSLTKNTDPDKYYYSRYGFCIGFSFFSFSNCDWGKNFAIFGIDNSSSVHIDNKKKFKFVLGGGLTHSLDDATITTEAKYSINF